ncbi:MAG: hypothetical protein R3E68_17635 [Burkholderiaceae bacterium]
MLDEPTNHLDLDAILWLEQRLRRLDAILLVVSHDRDFLDAVVTGTLSIEQSGCTATVAATVPASASVPSASIATNGSPNRRSAKVTT